MAGGGTERVVANLANEFVNRNIDVDLLLFAGDTVVYPLDERVQIISTGGSTGGNPLLRVKRIGDMRKHFRANSGCWVFCFSENSGIFTILAGLGLNYHMLVSERSDPTTISRKEQILRNMAYRKAEHVVLQTNDIVKYFDDKIQSKATVIPNPVGDNTPMPYDGVRTKRIVHAGRLQPMKNQKMLIEAFGIFLNRLQESEDELIRADSYTLDIYGAGPLEEELKAWTHEIKLDDRVVFHGFTSNVQEAIRDAGMFVLCSNYEGVSNSMVEAMAMGIPTISTDCPVGGARMYIEDGVNGILTKVGDTEGLSEAMYRVATDSRLASQLSENGPKIRERYGLDNIVNQFLDLIE